LDASAEHGGPIPGSPFPASHSATENADFSDAPEIAARRQWNRCGGSYVPLLYQSAP